MHFLVTLGPTCEPLDEVRRLTNFSTGRLGTELANYLTKEGHSVTALRSISCTYPGRLIAAEVREFNSTQDLLDLLKACSQFSCDALFHAAAVSDFKFGNVFRKAADNTLERITAGKFGTRSGPLLVELVPTPKIIGQLRAWYAQALLFGWKYEVDGTPASTIAAGEKQILENDTDYCVVNGKAYGEGYGLVSKNSECEHLADYERLFAALLRTAKRTAKSVR